MKKLVTKFFAIALLFLMASPLIAQSGVGKLSGKVTDASNGEPLIGANIVILNTNLGAATDLEGNYFILNITPGTYDVKFSYVGYAPKTVTNVRVVAGITEELNVDLSTDFTLPEIVIRDQKFFEEKATNTVKVYDSEEISRLPVRGVENLASITSGVVIAEGSGGQDGNATINVRGGRGNEVLYIVDGVPQNDIYTGSNYSQVSNAAIEQLSLQVGGYEAKYGQAQSGIVNVTTKTGDPTYSIYADVLTSSFTDDYGYNLYTGTLSGPIIPGNVNHTIFLSGERGWFLDADPHAVPVSFNSDVKFSSAIIPDNSSSLWRYTARTDHRIGDLRLRLGANINTRDFRGYVHSYAKNNPNHNTLNKRENLSFSGKISQNLSNTTFFNINVGYRIFKDESGDGVWFDNLMAYGSYDQNLAIGNVLPNGNGSRVQFDQYGIFAKKGRVFNNYTKNENNTITGDIDFTSQLQNHLIEIGGGLQYNTLRFFSIAPIGLASDNLQPFTDQAKFYNLQPTVFGYDLTGSTKTSDDAFSSVVVESGQPAIDIQTSFAPKTPIIAYAYLQDRYELDDLVLNIGLRFDYFDTQADILKNPLLPFAEGDQNAYDPADFVQKKPETYLSPRIGLGFPITTTTVFHAQYGKFIQQPPLNNLFTSIYSLNNLITDNNLSVNTGQVNSEITTQYEVGFRQVLADVAALNVTLFYKNTEGLLNTSTVFYRRTEGGQVFRYITPTNADFGTVKGLALSLDVGRISYFSLAANYTYSLAEGTGSSTSSSFIAAFRNTSGEIPKVIAPLDFDQRHTGTINLDFYVPKGDLGFLELVNANFLISFNSGRPYTPLSQQNLLGGTSNFGETRGYVNSVYGPSNFRIDMKVEKGFNVGNLFITPYVWIENLLDAENAVTVYRTTGSPHTTGWLASEEAKAIAASLNEPQNFIEDYKSLERNPFNFGIPRLIRLGLKINFSNISL